MSFQREPSPLFGPDDLVWDGGALTGGGLLHEQLSCGPGECSPLRLLTLGDHPALTASRMGGLGHSPPDADSLLPLLLSDDFSQYLVEDLFSGSAPNHDAVAAHPVPLPLPQQQGPPLIPLASRPRTAAPSPVPAVAPAPLAYPDLNAPGSVPYVPLSFDRVQDRHAAFDASLGSPLLDDPFSPVDADADADRYAPSAWDGSPTMTDVDEASPAWGERALEPGPVDDAASSGLRLFGQLSVGPTDMEALLDPASKAVAAEAEQAPRAAYSPVIAPTPLADLAVSPCAPLPPLALLPPLPLPAPAADVNKVAQEEEQKPAPAPVSAPAPPAVSPARSTRSTRSRRSTSTSASGPGSPAPISSSSSAAAATAAYDPSAPRVALDAPIRPRTYHTESRTSAKPIPRNLLLKRSRAVARGEADVPEDDELVDEAERRRRANTLAARASRLRKKEEVEGLRRRVDELEEENERLREWGDELRRELEDARADGGGGGGGDGKRRRVGA